jgi:type II secretory pathway component PulC
VFATPKEVVAMSQEGFEDEVILPWKGEEIKINAIAWSRDRNQRFALVNLKTVREGDKVQGLSVVEIEEDGVVFEQGGTKYRVTVSAGRR